MASTFPPPRHPPSLPASLLSWLNPGSPAILHPSPARSLETSIESILPSCNLSPQTLFSCVFSFLSSQPSLLFFCIKIFAAFCVFFFLLELPQLLDFSKQENDDMWKENALCFNTLTARRCLPKRQTQKAKNCMLNKPVLMFETLG